MSIISVARFTGSFPPHPPLFLTPLIRVSHVLSRVLKKFPILQSEFYRAADKSLAWPGSKQATATEDFDVHISYL